jgi:hypothetical protein
MDFAPTMWAESLDDEAAEVADEIRGDVQFLFGYIQGRSFRDGNWCWDIIKVSSVCNLCCRRHF